LIRRTPVLHKWILKVPLIEKLALASIRANFGYTQKSQSRQPEVSLALARH
jgi:hypothetical protein